MVEQPMTEVKAIRPDNSKDLKGIPDIFIVLLKLSETIKHVKKIFSI